MSLATPLRAGLLGLAVVAGALGCSSASTGTPTAGHTTGSPTPTGPASCPSPTARPQPFPTGASSDLPRPASAATPEYLPVTAKGVTLLRFTTPMPLRDAVAFLLDQYPKAGYGLGRGDAEKNEADAPFSNGTVHGTTRLSATGPCTTTWLVATTTQSGRTLGDVPQLEPHGETDSSEPSGG